jgi:RNA polymerase sigma-70 factor, ECF subfamily
VAGRRQGGEEVTQLLVRWEGGDRAALDALMPLVEQELRQLARSYLRRERSGHTLQPTALVNEAYLKLIDQRDARWQSRAHFYGVAAQLMRRILVDHARARAAGKRGGPGRYAVTLSEADRVSAQPAIDILAVNEALEELSALDSQQARVVELKFFGGLTIEETAEALGISHATVERDWKAARAWLRRRLEG